MAIAAASISTSTNTSTPPVAEIADIINHERTSWGNHAKQVTPAEVAKERAKGK